MDIPSSLPIFALNFNVTIFVVMLVLVILSGFFSMAETVFTSVNKVRLEIDAQEGKKSSQKALWIYEHYERTLTTILVANNIVNIALATLGVIFFVQLLDQASYSELVSTIVITVVVLIFGEILPKTLAKFYADDIAPKISYLLYFIEIILFPIVIIFMGLQKIMHKRQKDDEKEPQVNEAELEAILDTMEDEGAIESNEVEVIKSVLDLNDREVKDIMTPRPDIVAIKDDMDIDDIRDLFFSMKYSRIPVYHDDKDHIIGIIYERDFLTQYIKKKTFKLKSIIREAKYVSANMKVDDLIHELQKDKMHIAMVSGEYGEVIGLVTMEDALEELVGEIYDEHDDEAPAEMIKKVNDNEYIIDANIYLDDLFEDLELGKAPESQYAKLSGWLYGESEDIPEEGYNFTHISSLIVKNDDNEYEEVYKKLTFVVTKVEDRRIIEVRLFIEDISEEEANELQEKE